jgi:hypothetical protein
MHHWPSARLLMQTDVHGLSEIRTHDRTVRAVQDCTCLRAYGHCDWRNCIFFIIGVLIIFRKICKSLKYKKESDVMRVTSYYSYCPLESECLADRNKLKLKNFCATGDLFMARHGELIFIMMKAKELL